MWSLEQDEGAREIFVCPISRYVITIGSSVGYGLIRRKEIGKTEGEEKKRRDEGRRGGGEGLSENSLWLPESRIF